MHKYSLYFRSKLAIQVEKQFKLNSDNNNDLPRKCPFMPKVCYQDSPISWEIIFSFLFLYMMMPLKCKKKYFIAFKKNPLVKLL